MKKEIEALDDIELSTIHKTFRNSLSAICLIKVDNKIDIVYANDQFKKLLSKYGDDYINFDNFNVEAVNYDKYVKCAYNNISLKFYSFFSKSQFVCTITCYNYKYGYAVVEVNDESSDTIFDIYVSKLFSNYTEVYFIDLNKNYYENIYSKYQNYKERGIYTDIIKKNFTEATVEKSSLKDVLKFLTPQNIKTNLINRQSIDLKYKRINDGWFLITIVPYTSDSNDKIILTIRSIDEVLEIENKDKNKYILLSKAKSRFLSRISHDVKTPISNIISICNELKDKCLDINTINNDYKNIVSNIDKITSSSKYLLTLVSDYLDLGKIESGKMITRISKCDIVKVCDNIYNFIVQIAYNYNVEVVYNIDVINRYCLCDEAKLLRSIVNILTNSIKYSNKDSKKVYFNIYERNGYYEITIKDNGIGITKDKIDDVFEEYERINENSYIKGNGVGLQIVKRFVEALNGVILISSTKNGTTFSLNFDFEVCEKIEESEDYHNAKYENKRILVCEDNPINVEVLKAMIEKLNISYDIVSCGKDAIDLFKNSKYNFYDLVLMDIILPDISGYEVSDIIKGLKRIDSNIPIVSMSANSYEEDILQSKKHQMVEHLNKPIDYNNLRVILNRYLRK